MARYGNVDIFRLRGVEQLSNDEKLIFAQHLAHWLEAEVAPMSDSPTDTETQPTD